MCSGSSSQHLPGHLGGGVSPSTHSVGTDGRDRGCLEHMSPRTFHGYSQTAQQSVKYPGKELREAGSALRRS